jgi:hypothetical protein
MNARGGRRTSLGVALWLLVASVAPGCQAAEHGDDKHFLQMPPRERDRAILEHSPERQVELYLMVVLKQHPPDLGLADAVASNGSKVVPALTQRLVSEDRDVAKMHLIDVFLRMQQLSYYPVAADANTMTLLEQQVAGMKDPQWQEMSSDLLERIRAHK